MRKKGFVQIDYIIAIGIFIIIFALAVQYVSNYFSTIGDRTQIKIVTAEATSFLDVVERGYEPDAWPYFTPNSSVVLLLHLDNSTLDSSSYGNNGTSSANCSASVLGKLGGGCSFDGSVAVNVSDSASLNFTTSQGFTAAAWVNPLGIAAGNWTVVSKQDAPGGAGWRIFLNATDRELRATLSDGANAVTLTSYANVTNHTWSHVALAVDRAANTSTLYYNGNAVNSSNISTVGDVRNNEPVRIGSIGSGQYFNGSIDEVVTWNRSISVEEAYNLWAYEAALRRIGLASGVYRFYVIVNNTKPFYYNQSESMHDLTNELVAVNYSDMGLGVQPSSTYIIDNNNNPATYEINGQTITFAATISASQDQFFTVYVDDSGFVEQTTSKSGVDNITEVKTAPQSVKLVAWSKLLALNQSNYTRVKNSTGMPTDFSIILVDGSSSATVLNFGPPPPPAGNVVSFRRFTLYQNSTGAVRRGVLTVKSW